MKKDAVSLVELILVMVLSGILMLSLACGFVSMISFNNMLRDNTELARDARFATYHMTRFLRFGLPSDVTLIYSTSISRIRAGIEGGHFLADVPAGATRIVYNLDKDPDNPNSPGVLSFWILDASGTEIPDTRIVLSNYATFFDTQNTVWDLAKRELTIKLKFSKGGPGLIPIETKVKMLPE